MPTYTYVAKTLKGKTLEGSVIAPDKDTAREVIREKQYVVISLMEEKKGTLSSLIERFQGVSLGEKALFARQLAAMISAGVSLPGALEILRDQITSPRMNDAIGGLFRDIQGGMALSKSLAKHPDIFSPVFIAMVEAGETSGKLEEILTNLAEGLEKERIFRGNTRGAFIYPAVVISAMIGVFIVMIVFVVPRLVDMYGDIGADLPLATRILMGISEVFIKGWWAILLSVGVGGYLSYCFANSEYGKYKLARITFSLPVFGKLGKETQLASFCSTLSLLTAAGVPITRSLEIVAGAMTNILYRDAILDAAKQVEKGVPLTTPLKANPDFPPILSQMVRVGEETGKLDDVLGKLASFFEAEAEQTVRNVSAALEPIILIVLGVVIGLFVLAIITPIYNLTSQI